MNDSCLEIIMTRYCLLKIISLWIPTTTQSKKSVQHVISFPLKYKWFNLKENQQIFWPPLHCFLGRKIIFQVEVIAYLYHLCFELPSTQNCRYPWQQHICKCDKLKYISGFWRGGLLLPENINPVSSHYQSQQKSEILGSQIQFLIICFSAGVVLLTQTLKNVFTMNTQVNSENFKTLKS